MGAITHTAPESARESEQVRKTVMDWAAWSKRFDEKWAYLDEIEPLPDNFEDICKGKSAIPVYSK